ncbi:MAG TPA: sigma-54 dependent transcriptional regulator [Xanthomonadales bacterium]|nr:sigma-54 dependent transcriptional regulator [Xanthomonadales bacterium]
MDGSYRAPSLLIVDDDPAFVSAACEYARLNGFESESAQTLASARSLARNRRYDLVLIDLLLPDGSGWDLLEEVDLGQHGQFAIATGNPSVESAIRAVQAPVLDYLVKPLDPQKFKQLLDRAASGATAAANQRAPQEEEACGELVGCSAPMREVFKQIRLVAPTDATVFIAGESGTGKELAARAVHELSGRSGSFVAINCGAVAPELLASHLFGHERGSFTGAVKQHAGCFEQADGGTLFLDEITEMPLQLQVHLLRVLETHTLVRVGGAQEMPVDVRIIAASNRRPREAIAQGVLRDDLYYRLMDFPLTMPPLRERASDIPLLAELFLARLNRRYGIRRRFAPGTEHELMAYSWPGNVRELKNAVQRAFILAEDDLVRVGQLQQRVAQPLGESEHTLTFAVGTSFEEMERRMLLKTLAYFNDDKARTAEALGISLKTVYNRLARYSSPTGESAA